MNDIQTKAYIWHENLLGYYFVCGHYIYQTVKPLEFRKTDNVQGQVSEHIIFSWQMEAVVFIILQIFFATREVLKIGEHLTIRPVGRKG